MLIRDVASRPNASQVRENIQQLLIYKTFKLWSSKDSISAIHLKTAASLVSSGHISKEFIKHTDSKYLTRIISSGLTDANTVTLYNLVSSQHLPADFMHSLANWVQNDWKFFYRTPSLCEVLTAATLSKAGHLT